jgi:hypothetical protein
MPPHYARGAPQGGGQGPDGRPGQNGPAGTYPYSGTGSYTGPNAYHEPVHGGVYAYVIRDDDEFEGRPARPQPAADQVPGAGRGSQPVRQSRTEPLSLGPAPVARDVGTQGETGEAPSSDQAVAYGPDDPAYGPPGLDWYERAEESRRQEAEEEIRQARGAFEPLPPDHEITTPAPPGLDSPGQGAVDDQPAGFPAPIPGGVADPGVQPSGDTGDDPRDDDLDVALVGQGAGPLERIKDLYVTAEAIGKRRLDKHFDQLLERQRQLISDYFTNQEFRGPAGAGPGAAGPSAAVRGVPGPSALGDRLDGAGDPAGMPGPEGERLSFGSARRSPR